MIPELSHLNDKDLDLLYKAPVLVCILIAGADGKIDRKEIKEAISFAEKKHRGSRTPVSLLFKEISKDFEDKVKIVLQSYPSDLSKSNALITEELADLNNLWSKIDSAFGVEFYTALKEIAEKIATSSGGLLGYRSVNEKEAQLIKLPMIQSPSKN
jgi:hypothetical protein